MNLESFGSYSLGAYTFPRYDASDTLDVAPALERIAALSGGGAFDEWGTATADGQSQTVSTSFMIMADSLAELATAINEVRACMGKQGTLRARTVNDTVRWTTARCIAVNVERSVEHVLHQPVEMVFRLAQPGWWGVRHGAAWTLDDGYYLDDGWMLDASDTHYLDQRAVNYSGASGTFETGETITGSGSGATGTLVYDTGIALVLSDVTGAYLATDTLTGSNSGVTADADTSSYTATYIELQNEGDRKVDNMIVTVTPSGSAITSLSIVAPALGSTITYSGTVAVGTSLVIDCGAWSVLNDGADGFADLARNSGHATFSWLELPAGGGWIGVQRTGGDDDSTVLFSYSEGWQ